MTQVTAHLSTATGLNSDQQIGTCSAFESYPTGIKQIVLSKTQKVHQSRATTLLDAGVLGVYLLTGPPGITNF